MIVKYLTLNGVARRLGISPQTARRYRDDGRLPDPDCVLGEGRAVKHGWLPETVDAWNASRPGHGGRPRKVVVKG